MFEKSENVTGKDRRLLTHSEAAEYLHVSPEQVRSLIQHGQLSAANVSTGPKRPLYRITQQALNDFFNCRWQLGPSRQNKKFKRLAPVRDFFPNLK